MPLGVSGFLPHAGACLFRHPHDGKLMVLVGAGIARLGPANEPTWLPGFFMDVYPTTNAEYARFVQETGHQAPAHWPSGGPDTQVLNHPVVGVASQDAREYACWAAKQLPSSMQWETAARGRDGARWPWGDDDGVITVCCNVRDSAIGRTTPVDWYEQAASPFGVVDLCGNAAEWCMAGSPSTSWCAKGGTFSGPALAATPWASRSISPSSVRDDLGFRCVLPLGDGLELLAM
jgi:formylglycine-generating enzyme required for sulfatase activity